MTSSPTYEEGRNQTPGRRVALISGISIFLSYLGFKLGRGTEYQNEPPKKFIVFYICPSHGLPSWKESGLPRVSGNPNSLGPKSHSTSCNEKRRNENMNIYVPSLSQATSKFDSAVIRSRFQQSWGVYMLINIHVSSVNCVSKNYQHEV